MECEFYAALDRGEYIPVRDCPCHNCRFSIEVGELTEAWIMANQ